MSDTDTWTKADQDSYFNPGGEDSEEEFLPPDEESAYTIFDAPDYATFIKHTQTAKSKEAEEKVSSVLKAFTLHSFKNGSPADGAALLHYGPGFAKSAGDLTDVSDSAAKAIDMLTAPDNPWVMFLAIGIPMTLQLLRNHEETGSQIKQSWRKARKARKTAKLSGEPIPPKNPGHPITVKGPFGKTWTFHVKFPPASYALGMFRAQTQDPVELTKKVLSDEKLRKALAKQGITVMFTRTPNG